MAKIVLESSSYAFLLFLCIIVDVCLANKAAVPATPTIFIFGDSTADVGTNNFLPLSLSKANFRYNGIDFPTGKPTGRFSNGYAIADHIVRLMGYKRSPSPYLYLVQNTSKFHKKILRGVNFASGGSGLLDNTGTALWIQVVSFKNQTQQFETVKGNLTEKIGPAATASMLSKSLFIISIGSNDILDHYRLNSTRTKQELISDLRSAYRNHLQNLYSMGARKFGIMSVPLIGCCPFARVGQKHGFCSEKLNDFARTFYGMIEDLLQRLSSKLKGMKYSLGNAYDMSMKIIENPRDFGFENVQRACCGNGVLNGEYPCFKLAGPQLCSNRRKYLFWDLYHPSTAAMKMAARTLYSGDTTFVKPMNFSQLLKSDV